VFYFNTNVLTAKKVLFKVLQFLQNFFSEIEHVEKYSRGKVVAANHSVF